MLFAIEFPQFSPHEIPKAKKPFADNERLFFSAELTGFEPATSCVTGRRSNQTELQLHQ